MKKYCFLLLVASMFLSGCGTTAKFVYPSKASNLVQLYQEPKYNLVVAVTPFEEQRGDTNSFGGVYLYLIPLMPYGEFYYERPDAARMFNTVNQFEFNVSEDLAKAAVASLKRSGLFKDVFFTYGGEKSNADLIFTGVINSTLYKGKLYTYGLSVVGPILWFIGLPCGSSYNQMELKLAINKKDANECIWKYAFNKETILVQGLYYKMGHDVKGFTTLMEDGMNEAIKDLDNKMESLYSKDLKK